MFVRLTLKCLLSATMASGHCVMMSSFLEHVVYYPLKVCYKDETQHRNNDTVS